MGLMTEVTRILDAIDQGDPSAAEQILPLVYDELRRLAAQRLAHEAPGQTLQATALVYEAHLRLASTEQTRHWNSRGHFFAATSEGMCRILVEQDRRMRRFLPVSLGAWFASSNTWRLATLDTCSNAVYNEMCERMQESGLTVKEPPTQIFIHGARVREPGRRR
jgi:hypothetical protein